MREVCAYFGDPKGQTFVEIEKNISMRRILAAVGRGTVAELA
jgi:hypothetical protein